MPNSKPGTRTPDPITTGAPEAPDGSRRRPRLNLLSTRGALAIAAATAAGAAAAVTETRHLRALAADPDARRLRHPQTGRVLRATSADGTELHVEVFGAEDAPTVVLIPGWTEQLSFFEYLTAGLTDAGLRVVAYDLRGQGHSARPRDADYRTERYGEDLEAVLSAAADGRTDVTVAGHSLGGMSIAAWAADHDVARRARAAALINTGMDGLISSSTLIPVVLPALVHGTVARRAFLGNPLPVPPVSTALSRSAIRYIAFGPRATPAQIVFFERMLVQCPVEVRVGAGVAMAELDLLSALERLTLPTLVISGDLDRLTPASHGARMAQALPDSAGLIVLPRTGHMAPLECPELLLGPLTELACGDTVAMAQTATSQVG